MACLGETGAIADYGRVTPYLKSENARHREAAVFACARLGGPMALSLIVPLMNDQSGIVRRTVVRTCERQFLDQASVDAIRQVFANGSQPAQASALRVLARRAGWDAVPDILRGIRSANGAVHAQAWQNLKTWRKRYGVMGWLTPSPQTRDELRRERAVLNPRLALAPDTLRADWGWLAQWIDEVLG